MASFCLTLLHHYINWIDQLWRWTQQCAEVLEAAKYSAPVLAHYDPVLPLKLLGDVSSYSLGAVISHTMPDVVECPVTNSFSKWTQLLADRKEILSLGDLPLLFYQYVYGHCFTLLTDHKPLVTLPGSKSSCCKNEKICIEEHLQVVLWIQQSVCSLL